MSEGKNLSEDFITIVYLFNLYLCGIYLLFIHLFTHVIFQFARRINHCCRIATRDCARM